MHPYTVILNHPLAFSAYLTLMTSLVSLWIFKKWFVWGALALVSGSLAYASGIIDLPVLVPVTFLLLSLLTLQLRLHGILRAFLVLIAFLSSFSLFLHLSQGTNNLLLFQGILKNGSVPYRYFWSYDKGLVGLLILGVAHPLLSDPMHWKLVAPKICLFSVLSLLALLGGAYALSVVAFDPSLPKFLPLWILGQFFFVCIAEEALYRGLLQRELTDALPEKWGWFASILLVASLFSLMHLISSEDVRYLLLAFGAGLMYGCTYTSTRSIEASILVHFVVNTTHILLFSYPALA